ncbi:MAG: TrkA C-terminal domain-containing protein, partial [Terriglobia bacterium]
VFDGSAAPLMVHLIQEEATIGDIITVATLKKGKLALVEVELLKDRCKVCDQKIGEIGLPEDCVIVSLIRGEEIVIPTGSTRLEAGDTIIALTRTERERELKRILT